MATIQPITPCDKHWTGDIPEDCSDCVRGEERLVSTRLMEGVWDLRFTPEIPDDDAFDHTSDFWEDCYRQFVYSTDEYPDQAERVGDTDRIAIGVVHQDGNTVHGRDWDGRAVILELRDPE